MQVGVASVFSATYCIVRVLFLNLFVPSSLVLSTNLVEPHPHETALVAATLLSTAMWMFWRGFRCLMHRTTHRMANCP
ncbi:hypothetical protein J3E72DRAFT_25078 [Bipolaris maydis]|uniref:uncharacterized protein n=1 Tax=Cochliobolus heterostrophus TaxID=5016 RepID=UPI0024DA141B|nr:hypothetical protein J3E73DRAFT_3357 [Bipolaris maydis]KAJ5060259.1 hypothetical protein J3E74DRAFT_45435 [Bipolaris maydis]KAJ6201902.1 hypothetical protein J3E72DRAFT_25078 [Bipolaris maydis]KAJ6211064.1 hypothetical protein PSV09DRAFT_2031416 [Bipolaris maydis]KAJ6273456.1 hypothetical protein PSV08DRAFT_29492 [Bipolaris maydis]